MTLKNIVFIALMVFGLNSNVFAESETISKELRQLYRLNEASTHECDTTVKTVVESAKAFLAEEATAGHKQNAEIVDTLHDIESKCENNKDS